MARKQIIIGDFLGTQDVDPNAVYIGTLEYAYNGMLMSHLASPNIEALHEMAAKLGIRKWFQDDDKHLHPHYDVCKSKKKLALQLGAIEIDDRELINRCYPQIEKHIDELL
jgi:hypothetical protein